MVTIISVFPSVEWERVSPEDVDMDSAKLSDANLRLERNVWKYGNGYFRVAIVRHGRLVAEWNFGLAPQAQLWMASATKSIFSSILGIAIEDGRIGSADDKLIDYYPEAMDVPEGTGPKDDRYAFDKDRDITLRQLITNTSGYTKPGEEPGKVFHYQTFGMNVLNHAVAKAYGLYDIDRPEESEYSKLVDQWLRELIGGTWSYYVKNFNHGPRARTNIFGYYDGVASTALDMARMGLLWLNFGRWGDRQVIPEDWIREATVTAPNIVENSPEEEWRYGHGFWVNDHGKDFPKLSKDSFSASGAGYQHIWMCPSLDLVVVQSPGLWESQATNDSALIEAVVDACD